MSNSNHVLAEYMRRVEAGETVDVDAICAAHPEIADELRSYVAGAAMVQDMLKGSDTSQADAQQETLKPGAAHATDSELIGQMFGRYQVERQLGEGAMGAVYLAHDTQLDRPVALKIPKVGYGEKEEFLTRFQREAQAAAKLNHPGICSVFDFGEQNGRPYITMAYIDGQPLSRFIGTTQVNQQWIVEVIRQVADALGHAHQGGVVHRDLKAGNVLIDKDGKPVVTDFGLARKVEQNDESRITQEGAILGTPGYMSPEQVEGNQSKIGPATDIYALGVMLFELLTGELPFRGNLYTILKQITSQEPQDPIKLNPDAHPRLCALSLEMMSKEISKRPASMQDVVDRLSNWAIEPSPEELAEQKKQDERQQKLESGKQKVADLIKRGQYAQAISLLEKMSSITDADAVGYASWARDELKRVKELPKKVREGIPSLVATAKKLVKKHDYGQAAEMLQQIPRELRTPEIQELTEKAIDLQDEVDLLLADLHECVNRKQYNGIEDNVKRLLQLKPKNKFAQDLWEALNTYSSVPAKQRKYRFDEKGKLLPKGSALSGTVVTALLVALLSFGGMTYALTIYLKSGNETLTVQVDDELLANGDITLTFDGQDHVITGPEFRLTVSPGQYGYEVRQGNSIIRNPQQFTVVKDGRNVLEIGTTGTDGHVQLDVSSRTNQAGQAGPDANQGQVRQHKALSLPNKTWARAESTISGLDEARELTVECWAKTPMYSKPSVVIALGIVRPVDPQGLCLHLSYQYFGKDNYCRWKTVLANGSRKNELIAGSNNRTPDEMNVWTHLACTLKDGTLRLFVDGKLRNQKLYDPSLRFGDVETLTLGAAPHRNDDGSIDRTWSRYAGLIDEVRVSKTVRYTDDFVPSGRFAEDADTLVLYHCDDDEKLLRDSSGNGNHATMIEVSCAEIDPGAPTASGSQAVSDANGNDNQVQGGQHKALSLPKKEYARAESTISGLDEARELTVECWAKTPMYSNTGHTSGVIALGVNRPVDPQGLSLEVGYQYYDKDNYCRWKAVLANGVGKNEPIAGSNNRTPEEMNVWTHLACTLKDGTLRLFVDGKLRNQKTYDPSLRFGDVETLTLGAAPHRNDDGNIYRTWSRYAGLIDEVRVSKTVRYTDDFVPSGRFSEDADTLVLYHCDDDEKLLRDSSGNGNHATWIEVSCAEIDPGAPTASVSLAVPESNSKRNDSASSDQGFTLKSGAQLHGTFLQRNPTGVHSVSLTLIKHNGESWECEFKSICMHDPQTGATHATGFQFQANLFENPDKTYELRIGDVISNQSGAEIRDTAGTWKEKLWTADPYFLNNSVMKLRRGPWPTGALPANESWLIKTGEFGGHSWLHRESSVALQATAFPNPIDPARQRFVAGLSPFGNRSKYRVRTKWDSKNLYLLTTFEVPKLTAKHKVIIRAIHDDDAWVWINGKPVDFRDCGSRHQYLWGYNNSYSDFTMGPKTRSLLKTGTNQIAVRCTQNSGEQICDIGIKLREEF